MTGHSATWWAVAIYLSGCTVGPDYNPPGPPSVTSYTGEEIPLRGGANAQAFLIGRDIPGEWWTLFRSPPLDALIREALAVSPTLAAAQATLRQAQETAIAAQGSLFPQLEAQLGYSRQRLSAATTAGVVTSANLFTLATTQLNIQYTLDVFGGARRQIEAQLAAADSQRFQVEAAYLTLTSNLVVAAVQEASLRAQISATEEIIGILRRQLDVVQSQFNIGGVSMTDVLTQQSTLEQTQATLPPLRLQLAQRRDQIAVLAGHLPSTRTEQQFDFASLSLPLALPVSLPSRLVEQRPDVQSSAALLHQAAAQVGVATANMLPQISLTGSLGASASYAGALFTPGTELWNIAAGLTQPLFEGGSLLHRRRAAVAAMQAALSQYQATVLTAFQNVADALQALDADAATVAADERALNTAARALDIGQAQFRLGGLAFLTLLTAERNYAQARITLIQAQAARYEDTAALFQALGGGWWNRSDIPPGPTLTTDPPPRQQATP